MKSSVLQVLADWQGLIKVMLQITKTKTIKYFFKPKSNNNINNTRDKETKYVYDCDFMRELQSELIQELTDLFIENAIGTC